MLIGQCCTSITIIRCRTQTQNRQNANISQTLVYCWLSEIDQPDLISTLGQCCTATSTRRRADTKCQCWLDVGLLLAIRRRPTRRNINVGPKLTYNHYPTSDTHTKFQCWHDVGPTLAFWRRPIWPLPTLAQRNLAIWVREEIFIYKWSSLNRGNYYSLK